MATRYDVSQVPPQGGYVAKRCPVRAQNDVLRPVEPAPDSPFLQRLAARGIAFEASVIEKLLAEQAGAVVIEGETADAREQATVEAMKSGAPMILSARLPTDITGRRVGKPDVLIAADGGGYEPVDIKHHMALDDDGNPRRHKGDLLQLAHYQRMLEAAGFAAPAARRAGIIGTERALVWHDLDAPIWRTPSSSGKQKQRSTMEVYDFEFDFRLDIMAVAASHAADPSVELLVIPFRKAECDDCPWREWCSPALSAGSGHPSLIPRMTWPQWEVHRAREVLDRAAVAALDPLTARLVSAGVDVASLLEQARALDPGAPVSDIAVLARRPAQLAALVAAGVETAGAIAALDECTASYSGTGLRALAEQIDQARAALGPSPVYLRRGVSRVVVPRADVEIDVDMENVEDGVYLWGALLDGVYHPFVTWSLDPDAEVSVFRRFWQWFMDARAAALGSGRTFAAYCWHEKAENSQLRRIGARAGVDVESFIASDEWVDLRKVFDSQLITGSGSGLKLVAGLAGYSWPVEDPGGGLSMVKWDEAVGGDEGAREWLLEYNRGDVEATRAVRGWLAQSADSFRDLPLDPAHDLSPGAPD